MPITLNSTNADKLEPAIYPELSRTVAGKLGVSLTLAKGTVLGKKTSDGLLYPYDNANSGGGGLDVAAAILQYAVKTDASGNHFIGDSSDVNPSNIPSKDTPVFIGGIFDPDDLTGYDANALTDFNGRLLPNGLISIPL